MSAQQHQHFAWAQKGRDLIFVKRLETFPEGMGLLACSSGPHQCFLRMHMCVDADAATYGTRRQAYTCSHTRCSVGMHLASLGSLIETLRNTMSE